MTATAYAQEPAIEYGSAAELKGVKKVFVFTGSDIGLRNEIVKHMKHYLPEVTVTDSLEGADIALAYSKTSETSLAGIYGTENTDINGSATTIGNTTDVHATGHSTSTKYPIYRTIKYGDGVVIKPLANHHVRLLMDWKGEKKV